MPARIPPTDEDVKITNVATGRVLESQFDHKGKSVGESFRREHDDLAQRWRLRPIENTHFLYSLENIASGRFLTVEAAKDSPCCVQEGDSESQAKWRFVPQGEDAFAIRNLATGQALDLWNAENQDDSILYQYSYWGGTHQLWRLSSAAPAKKTRKAVLTIARDDAIFLDVWLRFYRRFFQPDDIYVLDHQSTHENFRPDEFVRIPVFEEPFSLAWQCRIVQDHQSALLDQYDVVLYTDVDEIVTPDPRWCDLGTYIDQFDQDFVNCTGYEVLHLDDREPAYDPTVPVLAQRSTWFPSPMYSKPLLATVPMQWNWGFHTRVDGRTNPDPNLRLIHLHRMDYQLCHNRHHGWSRFPLDEAERSISAFYQNELTEPESLREWFYHEQGGGTPLTNTEPIPKWWREVM